MSDGECIQPRTESEIVAGAIYSAITEYMSEEEISDWLDSVQKFLTQKLE